MSWDLLPALIAFAFVASATPGPNNMMLMAQGANFGVRRSLPAWFGVSLGHAFMVFLVGIGLIQVFDAYPVSHTILKVLSTLYMVYLAWKIGTADRVDEGERTAKPITFLQAAAFQWVNPKAWAIALAAVTVYAPDRSFDAVVVVAGVFCLVNNPSVGFWVVLGQQMQRFLTTAKRLRAFNITMAVLLIGSLYPILVD